MSARMTRRAHRSGARRSTAGARSRACVRLSGSSICGGRLAPPRPSSVGKGVEGVLRLRLITLRAQRRAHECDTPAREPPRATVVRTRPDTRADFTFCLRLQYPTDQPGSHSSTVFTRQSAIITNNASPSISVPGVHMMHATRITAAIAGIIILAGCGRKDRSIRFFEFAEFDLRAIDAVVVTRPPLGSRDDQTITISGVELQSLLSDLDRATVAPANKWAYSSDWGVL